MGGNTFCKPSVVYCVLTVTLYTTFCFREFGWNQAVACQLLKTLKVLIEI